MASDGTPADRQFGALYFNIWVAEDEPVVRAIVARTVDMKYAGAVGWTRR